MSHGNSTRGWAAAAGTVVVVFLVASPAFADVVTERWGVSGPIHHPGTLDYETIKGGELMRFNLSALRKDATVYRARLVMFRERVNYRQSFDIYPVKEVNQEGSVKTEASALELSGPFFRSFDITGQVREWLASEGKNAHLLIRAAPKFRHDATFLEIAYEGKLKDPPKQVSGLRVWYRNGQVFVTFKEIEDLAEGQERYAWGDLIKKVRGYNAESLVPKDAKRELRYRVYRHDKPITSENIGKAELLAEIGPGSGFNTRMVKRIFQGEHRPYRLDDSYIAVRLAIEPGKPVPPGTGVFVHTVRRNRTSYYAVVTSLNGGENTVELSSANMGGPVEERVAEPEPVLEEETVDRTFVTRRYVYWAEPPLSPRPLQYGLVIQYNPRLIAKHAVLEVSHGAGHSIEPNVRRRQRKDAILLAMSDDPEGGFYTGINNCRETLKSYRQGTWAPYVYRRQEKLVDWVRRTYSIDDQQIYCYASHAGMWELRHPEVYSVFIGWGSAEVTKGFQNWSRAQGVWGPVETYEGKKDEENPYVMYEYTRYVSSKPARTLPLQFLVPSQGSHAEEMGFPPLPRYQRALMDAHQPFMASIGKQSWVRQIPVALREFQAGRLLLRRDQSKPAFANCSLDDNPGCGDILDGDRAGQLNGYLLWETETITDQTRKWEMTVYLHGSAPLEECRVDLTPRCCQKFTASGGEKFKWTNTSRSKIIQSGIVEADKHGLVTLKGLQVGKGKNRISVSRE